MIRRIATGIALAAVLVAVPVASVSALTPRQERVQERRCTVAEARIGVILTRMKNTGERRTTTYQNLKEKVQATVDKAKDAGYDTTKLEADLTDLDTALKDYRSTTVTLYQNIQDTEDYACGESEGAFTDALKTARMQLPVVGDAAKDVQAIYQNQIKPDLQDLRTWLKDKAASTQEN